MTREQLLPSTEPALSRAGTRADEALTHLPSPLRRWRGKSRQAAGAAAPRSPRPTAGGKGQGLAAPQRSRWSGAAGGEQHVRLRTLRLRSQTNKYGQEKTSPIRSQPARQLLLLLLVRRLFIYLIFPPTLPLHAHAHAPSFLFLTPPLPPRPFSPRPQPSQLRTAQRTRHSSAPGYEGRARRGEAGAGAGGRAGGSGAVAGPRARAGARRRRSPRGRARSLGSAGELGGEAG